MKNWTCKKCISIGELSHKLLMLSHKNLFVTDLRQVILFSDKKQSLKGSRNQKKEIQE